jgi:hypothetical protein
MIDFNGISVTINKYYKQCIKEMLSEAIGEFTKHNSLCLRNKLWIMDVFGRVSWTMGVILTHLQLITIMHHTPTLPPSFLSVPV